MNDREMADRIKSAYNTLDHDSDFSRLDQIVTELLTYLGYEDALHAFEQVSSWRL